MIPLTAEQVAAATGATLDDAQLFLPFLQGTCKAYDITSPHRLSAFLAQAGHESGGLSRLEENLNYSVEALMRVWPSRFLTKEIAQNYARRPEALANFVYANRMGNGDEASGDGWKYRGKGLIQLTGKDNHHLCGVALGEDFITHPERLLLPVNAALSAGWFWDTNRLNTLADRGDIEGITRRINGGDTGLPHRLALYSRALSTFA